MIRTLGRHTHEDRKRVLNELVPHIKRHFGDNLAALAVTGSYARNDDGPYSDLELTAIVREMPPGEQWKGVGKIIDGMLVELVWMTRETYLARTRDITQDWHLAGSDVLLPLINDSLIAELAAWEPDRLADKCLSQALKQWDEVQESTAKVLNAIESENRDGLLLLLPDMLRHMLIILSLVNQRPYTTFSKMVTEARSFTKTPAGIEELIELAASVGQCDLAVGRDRVTAVFGQLELLMERERAKPHEGSITGFFETLEPGPALR